MAIPTVPSPENEREKTTMAQKAPERENMNENTMTNSTIADITRMGMACKKDVSKLPEVAYFRVQSRGATGALKDLHDRKVGAWAVLVSCKDGKGLRLVSDVAYEHGMKIKGEFATREEAVAAGKKMVEAWGKKAEKSEKAKGPTKAELAAQVAALQAQIEAMKAAA